MSNHADDINRNRRTDGRFGERSRAEADFQAPQAPAAAAATATLTRGKVATAMVPATIRDHARTVLGFAPQPGETLGQADARLALANRDLVDAVPGWDRDAYHSLAAAHVADTGTMLHPDDVADIGSMWPDVDGFSQADQAVVDQYAAESRGLLGAMFDDGSEPPF